MLPEETYLFILRSIFAILLLSIGHITKKYLDNKALGMQLSALDQVLKDGINLSIANISTTIFAYTRFTKQSYGYYLTSMIILLNAFAVFAFLIQVIIAVIIRYFIVFHQNVLNHFEDSKIINGLRTFVGIVGLLLTLLEVADIEYRVNYAILMNQDVDKEKLKQYNAADFVTISTIGLLITVFVQIRIEFFKKSIDCKNPFNQMEAGNGENMDSEMNPELRKSFLRFVMMLLSFLFLGSIDWFLRHRFEAENVFLSRLRMDLLHGIIAFIVCVILIQRNPKLYKFFVNQFK